MTGLRSVSSLWAGAMETTLSSLKGFEERVSPRECGQADREVVMGAREARLADRVLQIRRDQGMEGLRPARRGSEPERNRQEKRRGGRAHLHDSPPCEAPHPTPWPWELGADGPGSPSRRGEWGQDELALDACLLVSSGAWIVSNC